MKPADQMRKFIQANVRAAPGCHVSAVAMYSAYVVWCGSSRPLNQTAFAYALASIDMRTVNRGTLRVYQDVTLLLFPSSAGAERRPVRSALSPLAAVNEILCEARVDKRTQRGARRVARACEALGIFGDERILLFQRLDYCGANGEPHGKLIKRVW